MADDKKNIGPEVEKTETAPAPEQPTPDMAEPVVANEELRDILSQRKKFHFVCSFLRRIASI